MVSATASTLQVLVVDDDLGDVALVENAFAEHLVPTTLHHVFDGAEALAFLRHEEPYADAPRPDLMLLDLNMPRVDGRAVLTAVKADDDLRTIPVVVFTTSSSPEDISASYVTRANAYVTKPTNLDDFDHVLSEIRNFYGHVVSLPRRGSDATRHDGTTPAVD